MAPRALPDRGFSTRPKPRRIEALRVPPTRTGSPGAGGGLRGPANSPARPLDLADLDKSRTTGLNMGAQAARDMLGPGAVDEFDGMTLEDLLMAQYQQQNQNGPGGGGGGGRGGSGGGGGGAGAGPAGNPDPLGWNNIAMQQSLEAGYAKMLEALQAKESALMGGFDARQTATNQQRDAGKARTQQLIGETTAAAGQARTAAAGAYAGGDQNLARIMQEYTQMANQRAAPANATLGAFGAAPVAVSDPSQMQGAMTAQRAMLSRMGTADDVLYGTRGNVYNGLNQDVTTQQGLQYDQLTGQLAAQRQGAAADAAAERAQIALQLEKEKLALQQQEQARMAQYA